MLTGSLAGKVSWTPSSSFSSTLGLGLSFDVVHRVARVRGRARAARLAEAVEEERRRGEPELDDGKGHVVSPLVLRLQPCARQGYDFAQAASEAAQTGALR